MQHGLDHRPACFQRFGHAQGKHLHHFLIRHREQRGEGFAERIGIAIGARTYRAERTEQSVYLFRRSIDFGPCNGACHALMRLVLARPAHMRTDIPERRAGDGVCDHQAKRNRWRGEQAGSGSAMPVQADIFRHRAGHFGLAVSR